jgi:hypothetical protein
MAHNEINWFCAICPVISLNGLSPSNNTCNSITTIGLAFKGKEFTFRARKRVKDPLHPLSALQVFNLLP